MLTFVFGSRNIDKLDQKTERWLRFEIELEQEPLRVKK